MNVACFVLIPKSGATIAQIELAEEPEKICCPRRTCLSARRLYDPHLRRGIEKRGLEIQGKESLSASCVNDHRCFLAFVGPFQGWSLSTRSHLLER